MLLVYAMTRATSDGWGSSDDARRCSPRRPRSCSRSSLIELRSPLAAAAAADLPLADAVGGERAMAIVGAVAFSEFFLLTLYLQDVLHYSAVQSGVAFTGFALHRRRRRRTSRRPSSAASACGRRSPPGSCSRPLSVALLTRLPVDGHYFWDLFPAFVLGGAGMGLSFVPVTIASLTGVERADAGVASGPRQHEPPDRRRDRPRRRERDRRDLDEQLRPDATALASTSAARARPRLPDRALRDDSRSCSFGVVLVAALRQAAARARPPPTCRRAARRARARARPHDERASTTRRRNHGAQLPATRRSRPAISRASCSCASSAKRRAPTPDELEMYSTRDRRCARTARGGRPPGRLARGRLNARQRACRRRRPSGASPSREWGG